MLCTDAATVGAIAGGRLSVMDAVARGRIQPEGDREALQKLLTLLDTQVTSLAGPSAAAERSGTA